MENNEEFVTVAAHQADIAGLLAITTALTNIVNQLSAAMNALAHPLLQRRILTQETWDKLIDPAVQSEQVKALSEQIQVMLRAAEDLCRNAGIDRGPVQ